MNGIRLRHSQHGMATLVVALVLMMSVTVITLGVARTHVIEARIANNQAWNTRLLLETESGLAQGLAHVRDAFGDLPWIRTADGETRVARLVVASGRADTRTEVRFRQAVGGASNYLSIQGIASRNDSSGIQVQTSQFALPLSILTHQGESAPPLILNGCLNGTALNLHVRPLKADSDLAGDAAWFNEAVPCPAVESLDLHGGRLTVKDMPDDLWSLMFSLSRDEFVSLAEEHHSLPERERIYWVARDDDLRSGHWSRSLGEPDQPVALYLPDELACPPFSAGVRIYGVVFIDSNCPDPIADHNVEVFGSLIVNGNMNVGTAQLKLNHIQIADSEQSTLRFPILRSVWVPGSWRDF